MKRGFAWLLTLLTLLGLLSGCGGGGDTTAPDTASNSAATEEADDAGGSYGAWAEAEVAEDSGGTAEDGASDRLENAKMIYTARMEVETTAFDTADADLRTLVEVLGGYFEQAAVHDYGSGYRSGDYKVRIPADQFQPFLDRVGTLCHVTYQEQTSENVSEAYYDAESRLATQRTKLERLQNLLAQAENMEDIITIESAISDTELEIERLTGTLRQYDAPGGLRHCLSLPPGGVPALQCGGAGYQLCKPHGRGLCFWLAGVCGRTGESGRGPGLRLGVAAASGGGWHRGGPPSLEEEAQGAAGRLQGVGEQAVRQNGTNSASGVGCAVFLPDF